ncbi:MAG: hypothetical protein ACRDF4_12090 [Rhabdochlamydiaceae bacterium]
MKATPGFILIFVIFFLLIAIALLDPVLSVFVPGLAISALILLCIYTLINSIRQTDDMIKHEGSKPEQVDHKEVPEQHGDQRKPPIDRDRGQEQEREVPAAT